MSYATKGFQQHKLLGFRRGNFCYELHDSSVNKGPKGKHPNLVLHRNTITSTDGLNQDVVVLDDEEDEDNDAFEDLVEEESAEEVISEDEEEGNIDLGIVYFESAQQRHHKYLPLSKTTSEGEVEEVDIEEYCDSDIEEIVFEHPSIVIPSDDEDDPGVINNSSNNNKDNPLSKVDDIIEIKEDDTKENAKGTTNIEQIILEPDLLAFRDNSVNPVDVLDEVTTAPIQVVNDEENNDKSVSKLENSVSLDNVEKLKGPTEVIVAKPVTNTQSKPVVIGVRKVMVSPQLKSGIFPMKSILNKDKVQNKVNVLLNSESRSILKPMASNVHTARKSITLIRNNSFNNQKDSKTSPSLLKPITNDNNIKVVNCITKDKKDGSGASVLVKSLSNKDSKIIIKPGRFVSKGQSILKPLTINLTDSEPSTTSKTTTSPQIVSQMRRVSYCKYCCKVYSNNAELLSHIAEKHSDRGVNLPAKKSSADDLRTYTVSEIIELERELRDQSECCKVCSKGLWYLPTLRSHARAHPNGDNGCEACKHGTVIVKQLMDHFEEHAGGSDSE